MAEAMVLPTSVPIPVTNSLRCFDAMVHLYADVKVHIKWENCTLFKNQLTQLLQDSFDFAWGVVGVQAKPQALLALRHGG